MINLRSSYYSIYTHNPEHKKHSQEAALYTAEMFETGQPSATHPAVVKYLFKKVLNMLVPQAAFVYSPHYSDARRYLINKMCKQKLRNPNYPSDHVLNNSFYRFLRKMAKGQFYSERQKLYAFSFTAPVASLFPTNPIVKSSSWSDEEVDEKKDLVCKSEPVRRRPPGTPTYPSPAKPAIVKVEAVSTTKTIPRVYCPPRVPSFGIDDNGNMTTTTTTQIMRTYYASRICSFGIDDNGDIQADTQKI